MSQKAYIVGAKRSAIGTFMGSLKNVTPAEMGATVLKAALEEANVKPDQVSEVIIGNVISAGLGQNIARHISLDAGIPQSVPAHAINMVCGSGLEAVIEAAIRVQAGWGDIFVAGGVENMSAAPYLISGKNRQGVKMGNQTVVDSMVNDGLTDAMNNIHMGVTAENIAKKYNITREMQDEFALASQEKALKAIADGKFKDEIVPIEIKERKKTVVFDTDEHPRQTSMELLAKLRPAFIKDGTVTAGNASGINDGASMCIVASEEAVKKYDLKPIAEIIGLGQGGVDPLTMGLGPTPAILNALKYAHMSLDQMQLIELNEAFASQSLGVIHELIENTGIDREALMSITNVNGGAIALGHPVGASGNRILVSLLHEMQKRHLTYGLASLCIGGGMGVAVIVKMCD
ncbi:acetyl-CoA C-acetyltransferase [Ileibacterium valens]|uniref:acetyl-CoA C-acetyltransferase n=1 Tax=Ileibacterium valens TaxID=1862668 RepID=A0A1U7NDN7_9FIRM|nr:acetyl-CoA C-acetyltransferase [Ileibacterium valens]OLU37458.1 acetyl-CoA acetyltransferase [Ileibacterium valens]OLU39248.1 acetyl-CoA acetyltransferase [Erysipelotrichaceae bacterium NYU-BL-E8]OLU42284.1 acetyl-CoA acetyltransferase [Erysipelotrichaceae bacterium NYU-BL-F16]